MEAIIVINASTALGVFLKFMVPWLVICVVVGLSYIAYKIIVPEVVE